VKIWCVMILPFIMLVLFWIFFFFSGISNYFGVVLGESCRESNVIFIQSESLISFANLSLSTHVEEFWKANH